MIKLEYFNNEDEWISIPGVIQDSLSDETTLDESYDNATIRTRNTRYTFNEPFTKYRVFDGVEYQYYIGSETVQRVQMSKYYLHTYRLTEPTKIIERYKLSGLSVTQPQTGTKKTLSDVIKRALKDVNIRYSKSFALSDDERLQAVLTQECPEFSVTKKTTLFEFLYDYIGKFINAMPRLLGNANGSYNVIDFDFFEDLTKLDLSINETGLEYSKNEENASTYLETEVSNLVVENADNEGSIVYPYVDGWITPRSDSIRMTSDNAIIELPYNIKRILNFEIYISNLNPQFTINSNGITRVGYLVGGIDRVFNIKTHILSEKEWFSLTEIKTAQWNNDILYKNNTLYYSVGSNKIENLSNTYKSTIFSEDYSISYLIASVLYNNYKAEGKIIINSVANNSQGNLEQVEGELLSVQVVNFEPKNLKYRVTYIPYIDTVTAQINPYGIEKGSLTYNQSAETVNAQALGESMWLELQNQNTTTYQKTARYDNISDILKVGDIIDNKIITNVYRAFTGSKWINVLYKSNEDFIRKSQYIQENREYRPYSIPATTIVDRHIHTDDYCYVGYSNISNGVTFRTLFIESFIKKHNEISNVLITTYGKNVWGDNFKITSVLLTSPSISLGHSVQFDWSMVDNFSAGKYIENPGDSTPTVKEKDYTRNGTIGSFSLTLNPIFEGSIDANQLPGSESAFDSSYYTIHYPLDKDAGEKLSGSIQLHFLPAENDVIVSSNLAKNCPLIGNNDYNFTLVFTNENLNKYTNSLKEYYKPVSITKELNSIFDSLGDEKISAKISINDTIPSEYKYWSLIDTATNNLYCAGLTEKLNNGIYFSFVSSDTKRKAEYLILELSEDETYYIVVGVNMENVYDGNIKIPDKYKEIPIKEISNDAFLGKGVIEVNISNNITTIGASAFKDCKSLEIVTIGENVSKIGNSAFENCYSLRKLYFNAIECQDFRDGHSCFRNAGQNANAGDFEIIFGNSKRVPEYIFKANKYITTVDLGNTVDCDIGYDSFSSCSNLYNMSLGATTKKISSNAFADTKLKYSNEVPLIIPLSLEKLHSRALNTVEFAKYNKKIEDWIQITGEMGNSVLKNKATLFIKKTPNWESVDVNATILLIPNITTNQTIGSYQYGYSNNQNLKRVVISEGITEINAGAFYKCQNLEEIIIPNSVTFIDSAVFSECKNLKTIYYGGNTAKWNDLADYEWNENLQKLITPLGFDTAKVTMKYNVNTYTYKIVD